MLNPAPAALAKALASGRRVPGRHTASEGGYPEQAPIPITVRATLIPQIVAVHLFSRTVCAVVRVCLGDMVYGGSECRSVFALPQQPVITHRPA
jgi:hypothetical protein